MLKRKGKIGKRNIEANRKIKQMWIEKGIDHCENCGTRYWLSNAHRNKRLYYRAHPDKLTAFSEVLRLCVPCHQKIEQDRKLSDELFNKLRNGN